MIANYPLSPFNPQTTFVDAQLDVRQRLRDLRQWQASWKSEDAALIERVNQLDPRSKIDRQKSAQIASFRRRLRMKLVQSPLEISPAAVKQAGFTALRQRLVQQFAALSKEERLLWLNNFLFILTPDLRELNHKITNVRAYRSLGQKRNFLLGGQSGMGKSTYLDWYTSNCLPVVEATRNHVPVIKIDAPVNNRSAKPLFQRAILECGQSYLAQDQDEDLLTLLVLCFQKCAVEMIVIDEIEHITQPELRRRVLEISNLVGGMGITTVCAACHPLKWTEGDPEVAGRWNDHFQLQQYTGERLRQLLAYIELLLPFTKESYLAFHEIRTGSKSPATCEGPAQVIERYTGGILRDIMILIVDASARAIRQGLPNLTTPLLEKTWQSIQTHRVVDFLPVGRADNYGNA